MTGRTDVRDVAQNGMADSQCEWPDMSSARFGATNANDLVLPVQIIKPQTGDFPGSQPVGDKQHQDRAVALLDWAIALNRGQQTHNVFALDALRYGLVRHELRRHDPRR